MKQITERIYIYSETMNRLLPIYFEVNEILKNITLMYVETGLKQDINRVLSGHPRR